MKKFIIGLLVLCLVIVGVLGLTDTELRPRLGLQNIVSDSGSNEATVGVIGGADGPTEIRVTEGEKEEPDRKSVV